MILAIDPGTEKSGYVMMEGRHIYQSAAEHPNDALLEWLRSIYALDVEAVFCEMVAHYGSGMAVGSEVFETVAWIGRFQEAIENRGGVFVRVYRREVKLHLCGSAKAKDANVRQAILDLYGGKGAAIGNRKAPGPLFGVRSHAYQALAVGLYVQEGRGSAGLSPSGPSSSEEDGPPAP